MLVAATTDATANKLRTLVVKENVIAISNDFLDRSVLEKKGQKTGN